MASTTACAPSCGGPSTSATSGTSDYESSTPAVSPEHKTPQRWRRARSLAAADIARSNQTAISEYLRIYEQMNLPLWKLRYFIAASGGPQGSIHISDLTFGGHSDGAKIMNSPSIDYAHEVMNRRRAASAHARRQFSAIRCRASSNSARCRSRAKRPCRRA